MKAEELGTGILGKPAQAIVMKNGGRIQRKEFPVDEDLTVPVEHVDLGAILKVSRTECPNPLPNL